MNIKLFIATSKQLYKQKAEKKQFKNSLTKQVCRNGILMNIAKLKI